MDTTLQQKYNNNRQRRTTQRDVIPVAIRLRNMEFFDLKDNELVFTDQFGNTIFTISQVYQFNQMQIGDNVSHIDYSDGSFVAAQNSGFLWKSSTANRMIEFFGPKMVLGDATGTNTFRVTDSAGTDTFQADSSGGCVLIPQSQPASPNEGQVIYNSGTDKLNFWNGAAWEVVTSA